jgi:hypothetical protein
VIVDDFSGYKVVQTHAHKSGAADFLKSTIMHVKAKYACTIVSVRCDRDAVFMSRDMTAFLQQQGIELEPTSGYSPPENGVAERAIRTINECMLAMLADSGLKQSWWGNALMHAVHLLNCMSSTGAISPYEHVTGSKPPVHNLHIFGCRVWVQVPADLRSKFYMQGKGEPGRFVGIAFPNPKAYNILVGSESVRNKRGSASRVIVSRDVLFDESAPPANAAEPSSLQQQLKSSSAPVSPLLLAPAAPPMQGPLATTPVLAPATTLEPAEHPPISAGGVGSTVQDDMFTPAVAPSTTVQQAATPAANPMALHDNPAFEHESSDEEGAGSSMLQTPPLRRSTRVSFALPPVRPYDRYTHGIPGANQAQAAEGPTSGFRLSALVP